MSTTFIGWMGYGTGVVSNTLLEPVDAAYSRHPFILGDLDNGVVSSRVGGTVGPATNSWGSLGFAAVFDAIQGGNMLFWMPLAQPIIVAAAGTLTVAANSYRFLFRELRCGAGTTQIWPAGSVVAELDGRRRAIAGVMLQFADNQFAACSAVLGSSITMANLPNSQPTVGSGQLWNNGGIIAVA